MIHKLMTQLVLAASLLQIYPYDAGAVEQNLAFPEAEYRSAVDMYEIVTLLNKPLPISADAVRQPVKVEPTSIGVVTSAVSAIVVDRETSTVLFKKNSDVPRSIGSITKLMTALVFLETDPDLSAPAAIESGDLRYGGRQHLRVADDVTERDLLLASLVGSDNSATAALVRLSGMTRGDFIARMNERGAQMGMQNTTFVDSTGLDSDNRSVVTDVVKLLDVALENEIIREATQRDSVTIVGDSGNAYLVESTDELLGTFVNRPPYKIVGGKTGFLPEAGYCLGTIFSEDGGREIIVVVLGSQSKEGRFHDVKALAAWAYKVYDWPDQI